MKVVSIGLTLHFGNLYENYTHFMREWAQIPWRTLVKKLKN